MRNAGDYLEVVEATESSNRSNFPLEILRFAQNDSQGCVILSEAKNDEVVLHIHLLFALMQMKAQPFLQSLPCYYR